MNPLVGENFVEQFKPGQVVVVLGQAGIGKSALLIQLALWQLKKNRVVVHLAQDQSLSEVRLRYQLRVPMTLGTVPIDQGKFFRHLVVQSFFGNEEISTQRIKTALTTFGKYLEPKPTWILVDSFRSEAQQPCRVDEFEELKQLAQEFGSTILLSIRMVEHDGNEVWPLWFESCREKVDFCLGLMAQSDRVAVSEMPASGASSSFLGWLDDFVKDSPYWAREISKEGGSVLYSGGHLGAEAEFGACAEEWNLEEINYSYAGKKPLRERGMRMLTMAELTQGDVSWTYLKTHLKREFQDPLKTRKVLQTIWHQVNPVEEVFVIGLIQEDQTVKGGTGWAVELAKHLGKAIYVYDQNQSGWFHWEKSKERWLAIDPPQIRSRKFAGTGTRFLSETGRAAIRDLFARSFEKPSPKSEKRPYQRPGVRSLPRGTCSPSF